MAYQITQTFPHPLFNDIIGPCISIFQSTHRNPNDSQKDIITFKNVLKELEKKLINYGLRTEIQALIRPLLDLQQDQPFWQNNHEGIAIYLNKNACIIYRLPVAFETQVHVYDNYYILPLIKHFQHRIMCDVLFLSKTEFSLIAYDSGHTTELPLPEEVHTNIKAVLGDDKISAYLAHGSYGGAGGHAMYHGHKDINNEIDKDVEKFFRYVDAVVNKNISTQRQRPLILVALKEQQSIFRQLSDNQYLHEKGIEQSTQNSDKKRISPLIETIFTDEYKLKMMSRIDQYHQAKAKNLATDHYHDIAKAARFNNIKTMFIENQRSIIGHLNLNSVNDEDQPKKKKDILNALVLFGMQQGVEILSLDAQDMPTKNGVAVIHRFTPKAQ